MNRTITVIRGAVAAHPSYVIAVSGGVDSAVVLDLVARFAPVPPVAVLHVRTGMEPPETLEHVTRLAGVYGYPLHVAEPREPAPALWQRRGLFPLLGKTAGRTWTASHRGFGFRADPSECCRQTKLLTGRRATRQLTATLQFTGVRGDADSSSRGLRALRDGPIVEVDGITIAKPIEHWTDLRTASYVRRHRLLVNPVSLRGGEPGCAACAGGGQFETSSLRRSRLHHPELLRPLLLETGLGEAILAVRFNRPLSAIRRALALVGGLEAVPAHVFDFLRARPLPSYQR